MYNSYQKVKSMHKLIYKTDSQLSNQLQNRFKTIKPITTSASPIQVPALVTQGSRFAGSVVRAANDTAPLVLQVGEQEK